MCDLAVVGTQALPLSAQARKRHCRSTQGAAPRQLRNGKPKVVGGTRAPIISCVKRPPSRLAARYRGQERLLANPNFVAAKLRRSERSLLRRDHRLGRTLRRADHLGDRASLHALRTPSMLARAARRTRPGPLPPYSEGGVTATGTGLEILPDDDEVGFGGEADYTIKASDGRVDTILRNLDRKAAFAKRCPDAGGKVQGDMEFRQLRGKTEVGFGRKREQTIDEHITAKFVGHVNDDAELVDYDIEGEYVIEGKGHEEIAATGKLLYHAPTQVVRGKFAVQGQGGRLDASKISGNAVGPKGWIGGQDLGNLWLWAFSEATDEAGRALDLAEEYWRTTYDKITLEEGGNCVRLEFTPNPLRVAAGNTKPVEARVIAKADGAEVAAKHKLGDYGPRGYSNYNPEGSVTPQAATSAPGSPAIFNHTAPNPAPERWATLNDLAISKRGIAVATHFAERPPPTPSAYVGTISGYIHEAAPGGGFENEDWTGTGLRFDRDPGSADSSPTYTLTQGSVNWTYSAAYSGCTASGAATFNPIGGTWAAGISFAGPQQYHGGADYYRTGSYTLMCPPDYTATGDRQAFAAWWSSNANQGYLNDVGPNWKLQGQATDSTGAIHYEWSLDPVF
jgi:hypothetical protein